MYKKLISAIILFILCISMSGCSDDARIDKAKMAQTVTVQKKDAAAVYTFYTISSDNTNEGVSVTAESLEKACEDAQNAFIPNLSLARLGLIIYEDGISLEFMQNDFEFISSDYRLSPLIMISLADSKTLERFSDNKLGYEDAEEMIIHLKKKDSEISDTVLSIYNKNKTLASEYVYLPYLITGEQTECVSIKNNKIL